MTKSSILARSGGKRNKHKAISLEEIVHTLRYLEIFSNLSNLKWWDAFQHGTKNIKRVTLNWVQLAYVSVCVGLWGHTIWVEDRRSFKG